MKPWLIPEGYVYTNICQYMYIIQRYNCAVHYLDLSLFVRSMEHDCILFFHFKMYTDGGLSESFEVKVGLYQGSVLSLLLFAVVMDGVSSETGCGLPSELLSVDDLVLMAPTIEPVDRHVIEWRAFLNYTAHIVYSPLNSYVFIHWILDFKYILLLL